MKKLTMTETDWLVIKAYADCDMSANATSKKVYLSTPTTNYHLDKVFKITGLNPRVFHDLAKLLIMERNRSEADRVTALEYMERQLAKHKLNYKREYDRGVPKYQLDNIHAKINYYQAAVDAMRMVGVKTNGNT